MIYGRGMGKFLSVFGIPPTARLFVRTAGPSTFILTTLDTATRLGRYIFEEFFGLKGKRVHMAVHHGHPGAARFFRAHHAQRLPGTTDPAWKAIWPVFGATNQLLAALTLLALTLWIRRSGKKTTFIVFPMIFMTAMTVWALILLIRQYRFSLIGAIAVVLLALSFLLVREAAHPESRRNR